MYVWGIVENPKPGVTAVLEPAGLADGVSSGSVVVEMDKIVPIRICNLASSSTSLPVGTCLGILIETMEEPPNTSTAQSLSAEELPMQQIRRLKQVSVLDLPIHLQDLFTSASEGLSEEQQEVRDTDLGRFDTV